MALAGIVASTLGVAMKSASANSATKLSCVTKRIWDTTTSTLRMIMQSSSTSTTVPWSSALLTSYSQMMKASLEMLTTSILLNVWIMGAWLGHLSGRTGNSRGTWRRKGGREPGKGLIGFLRRQVQVVQRRVKKQMTGRKVQRYEGTERVVELL